jgi:hypothetical protein
MNTQDIIRDAIECRDEGQEPNYTADEYDQALLALARYEQKPTENIAQAMARIAQNGSDRTNALLFTADRARARANSTIVKRASDAEAEMLAVAKREARPGETVAMSYGRLCETDQRMAKLYAETQTTEERDTDPRFDSMLIDLATMRKRDGETLEQAVARLLDSDPIVRDAYAAAQGL